MTILEKLKEINNLIKNGKAVRDKNVIDGTERYIYTREGNKVFVEGYQTTIDKMLSEVSNESRIAFAIENILKSVGINITNIEKDFDISASSDIYSVFSNKDGNKYTFIEYSAIYAFEYVDSLILIRMDMDTKELIYDRFDFETLKYYHANSKISEYTLSKVDRWKDKECLNQNDLYEVMASDVLKEDGFSAYVNMRKYGKEVSNIDINKLDKDVFDFDYRYGDKPEINIM